MTSANYVLLESAINVRSELEVVFKILLTKQAILDNLTSIIILCSYWACNVFLEFLYYKLSPHKKTQKTVINWKTWFRLPLFIILCTIFYFLHVWSLEWENFKHMLRFMDFWIYTWAAFESLIAVRYTPEIVFKVAAEIISSLLSNNLMRKVMPNWVITLLDSLNAPKKPPIEILPPCPYRNNNQCNKSQFIEHKHYRIF